MLTPARIPEDKWRPLKRAEYDQLVDAGAFEKERLELIVGMLVRMSPQKPRHASTLDRVAARLRERLAGRARVFMQRPFALDDSSEPEPDVMLVPEGDYDHHHPDRAFLLVEVADATLKDDRRVKGPLYGAAGVPEYWIVNLKEMVIEVYREPWPEGYRRMTRHGRGESVAPEAFPDALVAVAEVLPPE